MPRGKAKDRDKSDDKTVEQVLDELGVDTELSPEEAAEEFLTSTPAEGEGYDDIEPSDTTTQVDEVVPPKAAAVGRPPKEPKKPRKPPKHQEPLTDAEAASVAEKLTAPVPELDAPVFQPPRPATPKKPAKSPSTGKLGAALSAKLPGAERVRVEKRMDNGSLGFVKEYSANDLGGFSDVEAFLNRYVRPTYGGGEYKLTGVDGHGRHLDVGTVTLLDPPSTGDPNSGAFGLAERVMDQNNKRNEEWLQRMQGLMQPPQQQDPIKMLSDVMSLQDKIGAPAKAEKEAAAMEATNSTTSMMQMIMAMQQQAQQQSQQQMTMMMAMMNKPKEEDPIMQALLMKLLEAPKGGGDPMPPPPPAADPMEGLAKVLTALAAAGMMGGGGAPPEDESKQILREMLTNAQKDALGPKDMIELMTAMKQERGTDDFKRAADNLGMMLNITNQLRNSTEGGAAAGFFDALAALFSNRDFAGSIAQSIRSRAEDQRKTEMSEQERRVLQQRRALQIAEEQRKHIALQAENALRQGAPKEEVAKARKQAEALVEERTKEAMNKKPVVTPAPKKKPPAKTSPKENLEQIADATPDEERPMPRMPANTADHVTTIALAEDEAGLVEGLIRMLVYFSGFEEWRAFSERLLGAAQEGDKRQMLQYLAALLQEFVNTGLMEEDLAKRTLKAAKDNFDDIFRELSQEDPMEEEEGDGNFDFLEADGEGEGAEEGIDEDAQPGT